MSVKRYQADLLKLLAEKLEEFSHDPINRSRIDDPKKKLNPSISIKPNPSQRADPIYPQRDKNSAPANRKKSPFLSEPESSPSLLPPNSRLSDRTSSDQVNRNVSTRFIIRFFLSSIPREGSDLVSETTINQILLSAFNEYRRRSACPLRRVHKFRD